MERPEGLAYLQPRAQPGVWGHSGMEKPEGLAYCSRVQPEDCGQMGSGICQPFGPLFFLAMGPHAARGAENMSALRACLWAPG